MSFQALYRRYRPRQFRDVVGQGHIVRSLENQIINKRVAHAYLFCGTRGTGKTSLAKIFAKAINCIEPNGAEPCNICQSCLQSGSGSSPDIVEIDAASNNGVDNIRDLRDMIQLTPIYGKYRVYIIDEVHMLSLGAFNALLKTLEEPPAHAVFILATTESQKIPATIISRCQRFDFKMISVSDIIKRLEFVLNDSSVKIQRQGLDAIARAALGGMRDALSLADQCIAFCGDNISYEQVLGVLGSVDSQKIFDLSQAIIDSNAAKVISLLDDIADSGKDLNVFCRDMSEHLRALLILNTCNYERSTINYTDEEYEALCVQAKQMTAERLIRTIKLITESINDMKLLANPRIMLECALIKACRPEDEKTLEALLDRLGILEIKINQGGSFIFTQAMQQSENQATMLNAPQMPPKEKKPRLEDTASKAVFNSFMGKIPPPIATLLRTQKWQYRLNGNALEICAPPSAASMVNAIKPKEEEFSQILSEQYEGARVEFVNDTRFSQVAHKSDIFNNAAQIFGEENIEGR